MAPPELRALGASGIEVSALSLGSWRTFEWISREAGVAVMSAARESGITFLDDARYDDETGVAPIPTGYSEVVFGELFRAARWKRDEVVVANKLWWEFWPEQTAAQELDASLGRMGFDYLDFAYSAKPPEGVSVREVVVATGALVASGKLRAWGVLNWPAELVAEAAHVAAEEGLPSPCAAQLPYSIACTEYVEDAAMRAALGEAGAGVVASFALAGGALTGKYASEGATGRLAAERDEPGWKDELEAGERLRSLAGEMDATPAQLALAFALANDHVSSVLFGVTSPEQVVENVGAAEVSARLSDGDLAVLRHVGD